MEKFSHVLYDYLSSHGVSVAIAIYINAFVLAILLFVVLWIVDTLTRVILRKISTGIAVASKTKLDDLLIQNRVPRRIGHLLPLMIAYWASPIILQDFSVVSAFIIKVIQLLGIVIILRIARACLNSLKAYFKTKPILRDKPIDSYIQVFMIIAWSLSIFLALFLLAGVKFDRALAGIGATSAIIILIFRDTILGFVASIQVSTNDMVRIGDWISFDRYGADGDVIEINLATVKVQNFDKTITTIPTYALISESFKNWRGMIDSPGRRIKRAIYIKQDSVGFIDVQKINELKSITLIADYLDDRQERITNYNELYNIDKTLSINGRNMTNLGVFRKYIENYLNAHSALNKDMTLMARQLAPTAKGIPLEVYCFSVDKRWQNYEYIMADIFDHIIAAVPYFDLQIFEYQTEDKSVP